MNFTEILQNLTKKPLADCTDQELYLALLELVRQKSADRVQSVTGRKLYYISAEFLIGKLLSNNLINLGLYEEARKALAAAGKNLSDIEEVEPEPSLGNGGLGRLAACFLDSLATLNLPGDGVGLRYHFGLFHQSFENDIQNEKPDPWLTAHSWAEKTDITYPVELAGKEYTARLYKLAVTGYEGRTNTLNLFDLDTIDESIVHDGIAFDKTAIDKNLTLFLYPDDSDEAGRRLRQFDVPMDDENVLLKDYCGISKDGTYEIEYEDIYGNSYTEQFTLEDFFGDYSAQIQYKRRCSGNDRRCQRKRTDFPEKDRRYR